MFRLSDVKRSRSDMMVFSQKETRRKLQQLLRHLCWQDWMAFSMLGRKRPLFSVCEEQHLCKKTCLAYRSDRTIQPDGLTSGFVWNVPVQSPKWVTRVSDGTSCDSSCTPHTCVNRRATYLTETTRLFEQTLLWSDTQNSSKRVLEHLRSRGAVSDVVLSDSVSSKFSAFRRDITEECGAEEKQHSWAVIEKREELIMYGPYYANYSNREHSEDIIIRQTQELLSSDVPEDWKVYVFTMNSPCLARKTEPCMLKLIHKAWEWWSVFGVKTHIGYVRSWGFKGNKEYLFRELSYRQMECITQSLDYESYIKTADKIPYLNLLCETLFWVAKGMLRSEKENFPMITAEQKQYRRTFYKILIAALEGKQKEEKKLLMNELIPMLKAAEELISKKQESFEAHAEKVEAFLLGHGFSSEVCEALRAELRVRFQQCWRESVQDRYAESVREKLTDLFNQCTTQLFLKDIQKFTGQYLQIGKLQL